MSLPTNVDAVVFDRDGPLVETGSGLSRAESARCREHGHEFGDEQKQLLIARTLEAGGDAMAEYVGLAGAGPTPAAHLADLVRRELKAGAPALPGARRIVESLIDHGVPVAVASNSPRHFVDAALGSAGLLDLFDVIVSAEDAPRARPSPDLCLAACRLLDAAPEPSAAFADSRTGVASAQAAGMVVVGVPSVPGTVLDVHESFAALAGEALVAWAATCTTRFAMAENIACSDCGDCRYDLEDIVQDARDSTLSAHAL
ncbi:HAD family phosphatase [Micromonospora sp. B11E3]|uniref:HAD family hydrolase n=1 Tax=Micromonospora sp. B11E3 TaxID=3153562 RepID=UPI00325D8F9A